MLPFEAPKVGLSQDTIVQSDNGVNHPFQIGITELIQNEIRRPIRLLLEQKCYPAALVLTYSGIDTMAYLNMPAGKTDVMRSDFIAWAGKYMNGLVDKRITGDDLYGARCSILHGGAESRFTREGRGRAIYFSTPDEYAEREGGTEKSFVFINVEELVRVFFVGVEGFLSDLSKDCERAEIAKRRAQYLTDRWPYKVSNFT